ncbi:unnamed protein product [Adineta steineri]|uniref:Uncharacterized protein n=1 Tax=Adineta steineri TaxID=433720 RepID=A0A818NNW1_9BILA|nr:unnamed protein product [Adineta steineri]CAF4212771.1 unnamed protein product [Adineta steineri]
MIYELNAILRNDNTLETLQFLRVHCEGTAKYMLMQTFFLPESTGGQMQIVNEVSGFGLATDVTLILSIHMPSAE